MKMTVTMSQNTKKISQNELELMRKTKSVNTLTGKWYLKVKMLSTRRRKE